MKRSEINAAIRRADGAPCRPTAGRLPAWAHWTVEDFAKARRTRRASCATIKWAGTSPTLAPAISPGAA